MSRFTLNDAPFAGRTGNGVTVAIIDSGVHAAHPHVGAITESACIDPAEGDAVDRLGHGTAVAAAIRDIAPAASLIVGKIFDRTLATNADALARGIAWATRRGARLINLSLGTSNRVHEDVLRAAVADAAAAGVLVVAARETNGVEWLPGSLPGVIAVSADARLERNELLVDEKGFAAAPWPRSIPGVTRERNLSGVSFAVANATGFLARLLERCPELRTIDDVAVALTRERTGAAKSEEWKYLSVDRLKRHIEESLLRDTSWAVFEPNGERLWARLRRDIDAFMHRLFRQGAFQGRSPTDAYFVRCGQDTMSPNDIERGVVNILVGFAPTRPAEFVVLRIQHTLGAT